MKSFLCLLFIVTLCSQTVFGQTNISKDYLVYDAVLKEFYKENLKNSRIKTNFVILNKTSILPPEENGSAKFGLRGAKGIATDFIRKNQKSYRLKTLFKTPYRYQLVEYSKVTKILNDYEKSSVTEDNHPGWNKFYKTYPSSSGYYSLSRVGYSKNKKIALVRVVDEGVYHKSTRFFVLKNSKGLWKIHKSIGWGYIA